MGTWPLPLELRHCLWIALYMYMSLYSNQPDQKGVTTNTSFFHEPLQGSCSSLRGNTHQKKKANCQNHQTQRGKNATVFNFFHLTPQPQIAGDVCRRWSVGGSFLKAAGCLFIFSSPGARCRLLYEFTWYHILFSIDWHNFIIILIQSLASLLHCVQSLCVRMDTQKC